jgi:hypothetical protein
MLTRQLRKRRRVVSTAPLMLGIDDATIISKIGSSKCQFDTSTDALIQLKQGGVSAAVLKTMVGAGK